MDDSKAEELIELMVERNVYLEPDFIVLGRGYHKNKDKYELQDYRLFNRHELSYVPERSRKRILGTYHHIDDYDEEEYELRKKGYQNMLRFMKMFVDAGGKVMTGTDTGGWAVPGLGLHHEMEILADEVGMTPMQVVMAATKLPAEGFRVLDELGTIEEGKLADMVIVNANPLQAISNLQEIEWVIKDGQLIDTTYTASFKNPMPRGAVEGSAWVRALGRQSFQGTEFGQPQPGIESISPNMVIAGDPMMLLTIRGVNFTRESLVIVGEQPVPFQLISNNEIQANIDAALIHQVGTYPVFIKNPEPLQRPEWGNGTSNKAHLIVNYSYE